MSAPHLPALGKRLVAVLAGALLFTLVSMAFFASIGQHPLATLARMAVFAFGDTYSISESLLKATSILLCALAVIVPARLGLISVGGQGQLYVGALFGTAVVLAWPGAPAPLLLPGMLLAGACGGALWGSIPGVLRARLGVNETITTLLLNYVGVLLVNAAVFGPWKDPANLGWPATRQFPAAAVLAPLFGTRIHGGLFIALAAALLLHVAFAYTRWGLDLGVLRGNAKVGAMVGLRFPRAVVTVMALGGALGGLAGIIETSAVQGRLQPSISAGYGLTGFLVAWLCGHDALLAIPVSVLVGGLISAGDVLQLFDKVPAASATVLQGLLFACALATAGLYRGWRAPRG